MQAILSLVALAGVLASTEPEPRAWDQDKAIARVQSVLDLEAQGRPWDDLPWHLDPEEAHRQAVAEDKPIFVFMYLRKQAGPAAAPC